MNPQRNYWLESIQSSADEHGVAMTQEQAEAMAADMETSHECYGMAFGHECIPNPLAAEVTAERRRREKDVAELERREQALKDNIAKRYNIPVWVSVRDGRVEVEAQR